jgi:hypothetical protein
MTKQNPHRVERNSSVQKFLRYGSIVLAIAAVTLNWWATQRVAALLGFPLNLNGRIVGHLYQPFAWFWWQHRWPNGFMVPIGDFGIPIETIWKSCERVVIYPLLAVGVTGGLIGVLLSQKEARADLHGSATWADTAEIKKAGLL